MKWAARRKSEPRRLLQPLGFLWIAKDGTERPINDSDALVRHVDGKMAGVVLVFRDVTEERRERLIAERLAAIVESSEDAIVGKDL